MNYSVPRLFKQICLFVNIFAELNKQKENSIIYRSTRFLLNKIECFSIRALQNENSYCDEKGHVQSTSRFYSNIHATKHNINMTSTSLSLTIRLSSGKRFNVEVPSASISIGSTKSKIQEEHTKQKKYIVN